MKEMFVKPVRTKDTAKMEKILNMYRVGLNDWDKSKVFNYRGVDLVVYTMVCTQDIHEAINAAMKSC